MKWFAHDSLIQNAFSKLKSIQRKF